MDDEKENMNKTKEATVELIYYLNKNKKEEGNMKLSYNKEIKMITYNDITNSFYEFISEKEEKVNENSDLYFSELNMNDLIYKSIRYFDGYGWILLNEDDIIILDENLNLNNLKIMIHSDIINQKYLKIKKKFDKIDTEISNIYNQIAKEKKSNLPPFAPLNLVVLTANPLMDGKKELRAMNEFNIITSKIYKAFDEEDYLKNSEFLPLTLNTLKYFITNEQKRPVILHLICKSTYIIPEEEKDKTSSENSEDYTNLIFEDDNNYYNSEFVDKKKLENEIFNYGSNKKLKENVNKIILIISTPLKNDVYNIFEKFGFRNIIIQHTTLADVKFIADFNYAFYEDIIAKSDQKINKIYEEALNCDTDIINPPTFCCCFHKHKTSCDFFKNLKNELYNNNECKNLDDFKELIPHFYHLYCGCYKIPPICPDRIKKINRKIKDENKKIPENSFCYHFAYCINNFKCLPPIDKSINAKNLIFDPEYLVNFCCCKEMPEIHTKNCAFIKDFSAENKNNEIRFTYEGTKRGILNYTPNYERMILFLGNNKVTFDVIQYFSSNKYFSLNIYGDIIENLKKFGDALIEYYLEKYYFFETSNLSLSNISNLNKVKSAENFNIDLTESDSNSNDNIKKEDFGIHNIKSAEFFRKIEKIDFFEINLNKYYTNTFQEEDKNINNIIYFIYVHDPSLVNQIKISNKKIIWFSNEEIKDNNIKITEFIKFSKIPIEHKDPKDPNNDYLYYMNPSKINPNEYIQYQEKKAVREWRRTTKKF